MLILADDQKYVLLVRMLLRKNEIAWKEMESNSSR
jgi:hypothetical protein